MDPRSHSGFLFLNHVFNPLPLHPRRYNRPLLNPPPLRVAQHPALIMREEGWVGVSRLLLAGLHNLTPPTKGEWDAAQRPRRFYRKGVFFSIWFNEYNITRFVSIRSAERIRHPQDKKHVNIFK